MSAKPDAAKIRPATIADLPAIVAMRDRLNVLERRGCPHAAIVPLTLAQFTAMWGETFTSPAHCWRVVEVAEELVGFGLIYLATPRTTPPGAYIHWAYLEETQRRGGLGRKLVDEMLAWARVQGATRVELQFIDGNGIAERFWTKVGFRPYARKCVQYFGDASGR